MISLRLLAAVLAAWSLAGTALGAPLAFVDVTAIDPRAGAVQPHATVVVEGDRIVGVQPAAGPLPRGTRRIDGRGKFLIPGLWDAHVHLAKTGALSLPLFLANGVTGVRDMGGDLDQLKAWRSQVQAGRIVGPRIKLSGPMLESAANVARMKRVGGVEPVDRFRRPVANPDEARAAVDALAAAGVDQIKMRTAPDAATFRAVGEAAQAHGLPFAAHPYGSVDAMLAARLGSVEHLAAPSPLGFMAPADRAALFRRMAEGKLHIGNTMVNLDGLLAPYEEIRPTVEGGPGADTRRRYLCGYLIADWREQLEEQKTPNRMLARMAPGILSDFREMRAAGVPVLAGTDAGVIMVFPGFSLHDELEKLVTTVGYSPMEALRIATGGVPEFFHEPGGGISPGQPADLVLLDANPAADIAATRRIAGVLAQGRWRDRAALDRLLADVERRASGGCR